jgi:hypothetical protein
MADFKIVDKLPGDAVLAVDYPDGRTDYFSKEQLDAHSREARRDSLRRVLERRQAEGREPEGSLEDRMNEVEAMMEGLIGKLPL